MPRKILYPEGAEQMNVIVPRPVKEKLQMLAQTQRQSTSQIVTVILEDWLRRHGQLPVQEKVTA